MTALLTVVAIWVGAVAAVATPVVYGTGNKWWTTYWGRTLLFKDVVIALAYGRSLVSLLGLHVTPSGAWSTVALTMAMAVALVANLAVMIRVTYRRRVPTAPHVDTTEKDPVA